MLFSTVRLLSSYLFKVGLQPSMSADFFGQSGFVLRSHRN